MNQVWHTPQVPQDCPLIQLPPVTVLSFWSTGCKLGYHDPLFGFEYFARATHGTQEKHFTYFLQKEVTQKQPNVRDE